MKKLNVAIIGYGKSGGGIHGGFFKSKNNDIVNVVAVVEFDPERAKAAKADFNCDTYSDYRELFKREDIDLVGKEKQCGFHNFSAIPSYCLFRKDGRNHEVGYPWRN